MTKNSLHTFDIDIDLNACSLYQLRNIGLFLYDDGNHKFHNNEFFFAIREYNQNYYWGLTRDFLFIDCHIDKLSQYPENTQLAIRRFHNFHKHNLKE